MKSSFIQSFGLALTSDVVSMFDLAVADGKANSTVAPGIHVEEDLIGTFVIGCGVGKGHHQEVGIVGSHRRDFEITYYAELDSGEIFEIDNTQDTNWIEGLTSGVDSVVINKGSLIRYDKIDMKGRNPEKSFVPGTGTGNGYGREGSARNPFERDLMAYEQESSLAKLRRQLAVVGTRTVLAVQVINVGHNVAALTQYNGQYAPQDSLGTIQNEIFGSAINGSDRVNLHSQYLACSHGKLDLQPTTNNGKPTSGSSVVTSIVNGAVEVQVTTNCDTFCHARTANDVTRALRRAFGPINKLADHVMMCMPEGAVKGIAFGLVNHYLTVYSNRYCLLPSAQLHEIGHNLGLAHSNEIAVYEDKTGIMSYAYKIDDQQICPNNAKIWQLGWFPEAMRAVNLDDTYVGPLKGQVNYVGAAGEDPIVIQIKSHVDETNYYVGYNHRVGHNQDTMEAGNLVTIQRWKGTAADYNFSWLEAKLDAGQSWTVDIGGVDATVEVFTIDTSATGVAQVAISYGSSDPPTPEPTADPTPALSTHPAANCLNDMGWVFITRKGKQKNCDWIGQKPTNYRCYRRGTDDRLAIEACPGACGRACLTNCDNDMSWIFITNRNIKRNCDWIAERPNLHRCHREGVDGRFAFEACAGSCSNTCI